MSTSSKLIVFALDHNGTIPSSIPPHSQLDYLNDLPSRDEKDARLAAYERVLFVRNPYARLYSAWKNKYVDMPGTCKNVSAPDGTFKRKCDPFFDNWIRLGYAIYKFHNMPAPAYDLDLLRGVTWRMFVDAVLAGAVTDKHWATQVYATRLCWFKPSFIAALEHSDEDLNVLLHSLAVNSPVANTLTADMFHANPSKPARGLRYINYTELYPAEVKEKVDRVFKADFDAFGFVPRLECIV